MNRVNSFLRLFKNLYSVVQPRRDISFLLDKFSQPKDILKKNQQLWVQAAGKCNQDSRSTNPKSDRIPFFCEIQPFLCFPLKETLKFASHQVWSWCLMWLKMYWAQRGNPTPSGLGAEWLPCFQGHSPLSAWDLKWHVWTQSLLGRNYYICQHS
jgi:hypothetical protein